MPEPIAEDIDRSIELAGELALAWCRQQLVLARGKAQFFPGSDQPAFQLGFKAAIDDMEERLGEKRFDAILEETVVRLDEEISDGLR